MKKICLQTILTAILSVVAPLLYAQNQNGLQWLRNYHSGGICNTPGIVYNNGQIIQALNFTDSLSYETGGSIKRRQAKGSGDVLLLKTEMLTGNVTTERQFTTAGYIVITGLHKSEDLFHLTGACRDSVFLVNDTNGYQYIGGTPGKEKGFIITMSDSFDSVVFNCIACELEESGLNVVKPTGTDGLIGVGTAHPDTTSTHAGFMIIKQAGSFLPVVIDTLCNATLTDATSFKGEAWVGGAFSDSLVLPDTVLLSNSGSQAFIARIGSGVWPYSDAKVWNCYQYASVAGMETMGNMLWVAVNFADSLILPKGIKLLGKGMTDGVIMQYDTSLNLRNIFHFAGSYSERIDRLYKHGNMLYVLANTGSPDTRIWINGQETTTITTEENNGIQTLFSLSTQPDARLEWTAIEGRLGRIRGVYKQDDAETVLAGSFTKPMIIDSVVYSPLGNQNVYLMRIADACISILKKSNIRIPVCKGDSLVIDGAYQAANNIIVLNSDSGRLTIRQPGKYGIRQADACECRGNDSLEVVISTDAGMEKDEAGKVRANQQITLADGSRVTLTYCGDCGLPEQPARFIVRPVPAQDEAWLDAWLPKPATLQAKVVNSEGLVVYQTQTTLSAGSNTLPLNAQVWSAGTYWLHLTHDDGTTITTQVFTVVKL